MRACMIILISLFFFTLTRSQSYTLAYFKGPVEITENNVWKKVTKIGIVIDNQSVKVGRDAEAIFTGLNGETVYLKNTGVYNIPDFSRYVTSSVKSSLSTYYLNMIAHQVVHKELDANKNYSKQLKNIGGVARGHRSCLLSPTNKTFIIDSITRFLWVDLGVSRYMLLVSGNSPGKDVEAGVLDTLIWVTDTFKVENLYHKLEPGKTYYWSVGAEGQPKCEMRWFTLLPVKKQREINHEVSRLKKKLELPIAMREAVLGKFYESKQLYENARQHYINACLEEPTNETFQKLLSDFNDAIAKD